MPRPTIPAEPGVTFSNGVLRLRKGAEEMRLAAWPTPYAERRRGAGSSWEPFVPEFRLIYPYRRQPRKKAPKAPDSAQLSFNFLEEIAESAPPLRLTPAQKKRRSFDHFRFSLPKQVAAVVEPFTTHQWPLILLLRYDEGALDLAKNNPALAYTLALKLNGDCELIKSLQCSRIRQRDLLKVLDLPASPQTVSLFRKLAPQSINGDNWPSVIQLLKNELALPKSRLAHLPSINSGVVEILLDPAASQVATPSLLEEVAEDRSENYRARLVHTITSTLRMQEELQGEANHLGRVNNMARLKAIHDEVAISYRRRMQRLIEVSQQDDEAFRHPPLPGIPGKIEPITSSRDLVQEGEVQGNCVASYANQVRQGQTFIYRVLEPQRATLSIVRKVQFDCWDLGELEARFNTEVTDETEDFVLAWLERHQSLV
ncbi:MAG: PcfJ domain-containing protein [Verrucomicrobiota bacterium]